MKKLILASGSPRRQELMKKLGVPFVVKPSEYEEDMTLSDDHRELVRVLSYGKTKEVADRTPEPGIVIGADTFIIRDGDFLGKPKNKEEAFEMLKSLSGRKHDLITGVSVIDTETEKHTEILSEAVISIRELSDEEIQGYIATGEPMDKAAAYAVQGRGAMFVEDIDGDFFAVMGLPVFELAKVLREEYGVKFFS